MRIFGLTGGTGSGKSEAARYFAVKGFPVIDADRIGHEVIAPGGVAEEAVVQEFGPEIQSCGKIDRTKLGARVFNDSASLERLNRIVQPAIAATIGRQCRHYAEAGHEAMILDAALLCDGGSREPWLSGVILILCPEEVRVARLMADRGWPREEACRRMAAQFPPENKRAVADWIVLNDGTIEALHGKLDAIIESIHGTVDGS